MFAIGMCNCETNITGYIEIILMNSSTMMWLIDYDLILIGGGVFMNF